jgi:hypothetical protein
VRKSYLAALLVMISALPAFGQYAQVIQACSKDTEQFCVATAPARAEFAACIKARFETFSEPCKAALVRVAAVSGSCRADIEAQCPSVRPGAGRVFLCVKDHYAALSEQCKSAIGQAALRKMRGH